MLKILVLPSILINTNAAELSLHDHLELARDALATLDSLADACLKTDPVTLESPCARFSEALNGEILNQYLTNCRAAKTWREQFVASQVENPLLNVPIDADENLSSMINIEFLCGEDALLKRAGSVAIAYGQTLQSSGLSSSSVGSLNRQLNEMRQHELITRERNRLFENMQQQQLQQKQETQRQFQNLELEIIRQENSPRYAR
ncbi:MAG: hypothetical protein JKY98_00200 [Gammaproteobacteria bacterium]|nr:hypothetical protein [Gammaproteobacteria bacterium]